MAVAVNPDDARYKGLNDVKLWHPFRKCTIPIIYDQSVDKNFGTGISVYNNLLFGFYKYFIHSILFKGQ